MSEGEATAAAGDEQLDSELLAEFEDLVESTQDAGVRNVLKRYKAKLVKNEVVSEKALQGLTAEQLMACGLSPAAAAALKEVFKAGAGSGVAGGPTELVEVMKAGFKDVVATLKAPNSARVKLPSALSNISQTAWQYVQQDFGLQVVALLPADLEAVGPVPSIPAYQWQDTREDAQKEEYMAYLREIIPPGKRTEWIQGDKHKTMLYADQVHTWPGGEAEAYRLAGTPDAVAIVEEYKDLGARWEGIRLTVEVKKTIQDKCHWEAGAQLVCANIRSKFKPVAILTDLVDEWYLKYMSGNKLCGGRFPSRAAAVAFIKAWLEQERVVESTESEAPLEVSGQGLDERGLGPMLKRARYSYRVSGEAPGEEACLADLADCLPREEACEVLCMAGLQSLMQHYRPLTLAPSSMYS